MILKIRLFFIFLFFPVVLLGADNFIKFGLTLGISGKYKDIAIMQKRGYELWAEKINNGGGILGKKVELVIYDDRSSPEVAKERYLELILVDKVNFLFGPYSSDITEAILPIIAKYKYPLLAAGASSDELWQKESKYVFGVYSVASRYTIGFLEMLVMNNINKIAVVSSADSFSTYIADGTEKWAKRFGMNIVFFGKFEKDKEDLDHIVGVIQYYDVDVLILCGHYLESVNMMKSFKSANWFPKVYYASVGPVLQDFYNEGGKYAEKVFSSTHWHNYSSIHFPGSENFSNVFIDKYKCEPSYHAATAYAAGEIIETAIQKSGDFNRERIRNILEVMDTITIIGRYGVDSDGRQIRHFPLIMQWQNGKKEIVWPKEFQTAEPLLK